MSQRRRRVLSLALSAAVVLVLVGCGGGDDPESAGTSPTAPGTVAPTGPATDPFASQIEDGVFAGQGVLLPIPEGWELNQQLMASGVVYAAPPGDQANQYLLGADDVANSPGVQLESNTIQGVIDGVREQLAQDPTVDEAVDVAGAEEARRLMFEDIPAQQGNQTEQTGTPQTSDQLVIVAASADGQIALFNYVAVGDSFDQAVADLLLAEVGLDPDSEPTRPPAPTGTPTGGGSAPTG